MAMKQLDLQSLLLPDVTWLPWCSGREALNARPPDGAQALFARLSPSGWEYEVLHYHRVYGWHAHDGDSRDVTDYRWYLALTRWQ